MTARENMRLIDCNSEYILLHKDEFVELYKSSFLIHHPRKAYFSYPFFEEIIDKKTNYVQQEQGKILAAEDNGVVVGWLHIYIKRFLDEKRLMIADIVVREDYQGCGIGKSLFSIAQEYAKEMGCHCIEVLAINTEQAVSFYQKLGFEVFRMDMVKYFPCQ